MEGSFCKKCRTFDNVQDTLRKEEAVLILSKQAHRKGRGTAVPILDPGRFTSAKETQYINNIDKQLDATITAY